MYSVIVEDSPNTNTTNIMKNRSLYGEATNRRGRIKERS
jgi:hypothetical protein